MGAFQTAHALPGRSPLLSLTVPDKPAKQRGWTVLPPPDLRVGLWLRPPPDGSGLGPLLHPSAYDPMSLSFHDIRRPTVPGCMAAYKVLGTQWVGSKGPGPWGARMKGGLP